MFGILDQAILYFNVSLIKTTTKVAILYVRPHWCCYWRKIRIVGNPPRWRVHPLS